MLVQTLVLICALTCISPIALQGKTTEITPKALQNDASGEHKIVAAKVTVNGNYAHGKNKKLEKIVAVASVPLSQVDKGKNRKKGDIRLTIIEGKNGKRKIVRKNLDKSSELYAKLRQTLDDSIIFYKQNHLDAIKQSTGKRDSASRHSSSHHSSSHHSSSHRSPHHSSSGHRK